MIYYYIALASVIILLTFLIFRNEKEKKRKKEEEKKEKEKKNSTIPVKEPEKEILKEIPDFDEESYISDTFNTIFHSLQIEDWRINPDDHSISFIRDKVDSQNRRSSSIELKVKFSFVNIKDKDFNYINGKEFTISTITLTPPDSRELFVFKGILKDEYLKYFYDIYVKFKSKSNDIKKNRLDNSLKSINEIVGLSAIRDSKLSELLG